MLGELFSGSVYHSLTYLTKGSQNDSDKQDRVVSATALEIFHALFECGGITSHVTCLNYTKRYPLEQYFGNYVRWPKRSSAVRNMIGSMKVLRYERNPGINHSDASSTHESTLSRVNPL